MGTQLHNVNMEARQKLLCSLLLAASLRVVNCIVSQMRHELYQSRDKVDLLQTF